jgi:3-deoxy-D-manno-octulosonic-acid transferase
VGGSTHPPEEHRLVDAVIRLRDAVPGLRLVLAPRHIRRAWRLRRAIERRGCRVVSWSRIDSEPAAWDVLLVDEVGWLADIYACADVAFVGGTLAHRGGQNVLEPVSRGCPVVVGPHVEHIAPIVSALRQAGGIVCLEGGGDQRQELHDALRRLLLDAHHRAEVAGRARRVLEQSRGAAQLCARRISQHLTATSNSQGAQRLPEREPAGACS